MQILSIEMKKDGEKPYKVHKHIHTQRHTSIEFEFLSKWKFKFGEILKREKWNELKARIDNKMLLL